MRPLIKKGQWFYRPINLVPSSSTAKGKGDLTFQRKTEWNLGTILSPHVRESKVKGAIHSTKISGNFGPKLNGSVWSNPKSFEKTGPPFEVDHFSRSDRLEFWLNGSRPGIPILSGIWIISFGLYSRFQSSGFQIPQAKIHGTNLFYSYIRLSVI